MSIENTNVQADTAETTVAETATTGESTTVAQDRIAAAKAAVLAEVAEASANNKVKDGAWNTYLTDIGSNQAKHDEVLGERGDFVRGAALAHGSLARDFLTKNADAQIAESHIGMGGRGNYVELTTKRHHTKATGIGADAGKVEAPGHTTMGVSTAAVHPARNNELKATLNEVTAEIAEALAKLNA